MNINITKEMVIKGAKIVGSLCTAGAIVAEAVLGTKENPILAMISKATPKK